MRLAKGDTLIPNMVPIRIEEVLLHHDKDIFRKETRLRIERGDTVLFYQDQDEINFQHANGEEQMCVPAGIIERVRHLSHHGAMKAHPSVRHLYTYMKRSFC